MRVKTKPNHPSSSRSPVLPSTDIPRYRAERPGKHRLARGAHLKRWFILFLLLLLILGVVTLPAAEPAPTPELTSLQEKIERILQHTRTPGAGIALVRHDGPEWIAGLGLAEVATRRPATSDTLFRIGSTSKAFVALALLKLQEEGKLSLDDTLKSRAPYLWFSNPWEETDPVRIVHLLEHTSGWDDLGFRDYAFNPPEEVSLRAALDLRPISRTSRWRPGTRFAYSNMGPGAAAYVVEKVTGQRFEDYIEQHWFRPLGMTNASYLYTPEVERNLTKLYASDGKTALPYWKISPRPSGAINASAREMANYVQFHLHRGVFNRVPLLSPSSFDRMERPSTTFAAREGVTAGYGLHNYATIHEGRAWHGHNGGVKGGLTEFAYLPEAGVGYVVMLNSMSGRALGEIGQAIRWHLTRSLPAPAPPPGVPVSATLARDYRGWYEYDDPRLELTRFFLRFLSIAEVELDANSLRFWFPFSRRHETWTAIGERTFRLHDAPVATLALVPESSDGTFIQTTAQGGYTWRRIPGWRVALQFGLLALAALLLLTTLVFAFVWAPRAFLGRLRAAGSLSVRVLPLLGTVCILALSAIVTTTGMIEGLERYGRITPWSASIFVLTSILPLLAVAGIVQAVRHRHACGNRIAWWHAFGTSLALALVAAYLAWHGIIGLRTWA